MKFIIVSVVSVFATSVTVLADEPSALRQQADNSKGADGPSALRQNAADLNWRLPRYATLEGDILTVDVPEEAAREGCCVMASVDLAPFDGLPLEASVVRRTLRQDMEAHRRALQGT